jgi:hypothetical protein
MAKPRILLWDVENSHNLGLFFDLRNNDFIPHQNIVTERHFFCISYKWLGERKIHTISILDDPQRFKKDKHDDFYVISEFRKVIEQADAQVFHHGDRFDEPMFNARLAFYNLPPLPKIINIDTKKIASKYFRFNSNRLDYLARFLGYKGKMANPQDLWIRCWEGHVASLKHMAKYNRQDIDILEYVYKRLSPFVKNTKLNMNMWSGGTPVCPSATCGGENLRRGGVNKTRTNTYQRFQCLDCGTWCDERKALKIDAPKLK